jgi:hypothetical protein
LKPQASQEIEESVKRVASTLGYIRCAVEGRSCERPHRLETDSALLGTILAVGWTCPRSLLHQIWWCHLSTTSAHSKAQARRWALWKPILRSI